MSQSQRMLVAGTGISGLAATELILELGGEVVLYDSNPNLNSDMISAKISQPERVMLVLGELQYNDLSGVQLCVISPGIPLEAPFIEMLDELKIPVWSEIQLAFQCAKGKMAAITGTNGKTTTTSLVGAIIKAWKNEVFVVGNIGVPYTKVALSTTEESVTVAEVSSFQLETIMDFRPDVSAILNITPDHLDRHHTMKNYIEVKESITVNQTSADCCVLNYDDPVLREFGQQKELKPRVVFFSISKVLEEGCYLEDGQIIYAQKAKKIPVIELAQLQLLGQHNHENVMAAIAVCLEMGVPLEIIRSGLKAFQGVEHRIEFVLERVNVRYYNDSKGTNPDASINAIKAMPGPVLLIAGGYNKGADYTQWVKSFGRKVRYLVLIGETRDEIAACAKANGFHEIMYAEDMAEAVRVCASYANMGDYVLLSPACASWDMYKNYEERGQVFKQCVRDL